MQEIPDPLRQRSVPIIQIKPSMEERYPQVGTLIGRISDGRLETSHCYNHPVYVFNMKRHNRAVMAPVMNGMPFLESDTVLAEWTLLTRASEEDSGLLEVVSAICDVVEADFVKNVPITQRPVKIPFPGGVRLGYCVTFVCGFDDSRMHHNAYFVLPEGGINSCIREYMEMWSKALMKRANGLHQRAMDRAMEDSKKHHCLATLSEIRHDQMIIDPSVEFPKTVALLRKAELEAHANGSIYDRMMDHNILVVWTKENGTPEVISSTPLWERFDDFWAICHAIGIGVDDKNKIKLIEHACGLNQ